MIDIDRSEEWCEPDGRVKVTLEDGGTFGFHVFGLSDEEYIRRSREIVRVECEEAIKERLRNLITWLTMNRPKLKPYRFTELKSHFRIEHKSHSSEFWGAHCFVPKEDFETRTTGPMQRGKLYMPATFDRPAKHPRGDLFDRSTWDTAFGEYGMRYLR